MSASNSESYTMLGQKMSSEQSGSSEPQEKADVNNWIKTFHKNHPANLANVCKECHSKWTKEGIVHKRVKTTEGYKLVEQ